MSAKHTPRLRIDLKSERNVINQKQVLYQGSSSVADNRTETGVDYQRYPDGSTSSRFSSISEKFSNLIYSEGVGKMSGMSAFAGGNQTSLLKDDDDDTESNSSDRQGRSSVCGDDGPSRIVVYSTLPQLSDEIKNPISHLQELCVANGFMLPIYIDLDSVGPPHARRFSVQATGAGSEAIGIGNSKKVAKTEAAKQLLAKINSDTSKSTANGTLSPLRQMSPLNPPANQTQKLVSPLANLSLKETEDNTNANVVQWIIQFCQKNRVIPPAYEMVEEKGEAHDPMFTIAATISELGLSAVGHARNKQSAKRECALHLWEQIQSMKPSMEVDSTRKLENLLVQAPGNFESDIFTTQPMNSYPSNQLQLISNRSETKLSQQRINETMVKVWFFEALLQQTSSIAKIRENSGDQYVQLEEIARLAGAYVLSVTMSDPLPDDPERNNFRCIIDITSQSVQIMSVFGSSLESRVKAKDAAASMALEIIKLHSNAE